VGALQELMEGCLSMRPSGMCSLRSSVQMLNFLLRDKAHLALRRELFHTHLHCVISPLPIAHGRLVSSLLGQATDTEHVDLDEHDTFLINCRLDSAQITRDGPLRAHTRRRDEEACRDAMSSA
jgi:hypothetical protein